MLPDRVSNPGPLTYESGTLPIALRGPASMVRTKFHHPLVLEKKLLKVLTIYMGGESTFDV